MATDTQTLTLELTLTPAHIAALRHHVRSERQSFLGIVAFCATVGALLPLIPIPSRVASLWEGLMIIGYVFGLAAVMDWLWWRRPIEAAVRQGVYCRTTGPISISTAGHHGASVYVGDVLIQYVPVAMYGELREL